jgi:eukaryotic-like serine/threonine-protein kinase
MRQNEWTTPAPRARIFISYARKDNEAPDPSLRWLERLQAHLAPLAQEGLISTFSDLDIALGETWHDRILAQLMSAKVAILLVSPNFLASSYIRNSELPLLLRRARQGGLAIIPVIVRPCLFKTTTFRFPDPVQGPEQFSLADLQVANAHDRALSELDETEQDRVLLTVAERVQALALEDGLPPEGGQDAGAPVRSSGTRPRRASSNDDQVRQRLIRRVRRDWVDAILGQSLYHVARLPLTLSPSPETLERPWALVVHQAGEAAQALRPDARIQTVFSDFEESLLILGAPGSGKTVLLLELARDLLAVAESDSTRRVPLVFHLSTWALHRGSLEEWLITEMDKRYGLAKRDARPWVTSGRILPLLDGLDEVAAESRGSCVEAINAFQRTYGALAVCSRASDYALLGSKLTLRGAVVIQPLTREGIAIYLERTGEPLAHMASAFRDDETLWSLLDTPLMISVAALAYQGRSPADWAPSGPPDEQRRQLFARYVDAMFERPGRARRPGSSAFGKEPTIRWLSWLARTMQREGQTVFYVGWLQAAWLQRVGLRRLFRLGVGAMCGIGIGVAFMSLVQAQFGYVPTLLPCFVLLSGLLVSFRSAILGSVVCTLVAMVSSWLIGMRSTTTSAQELLLDVAFLGVVFWLVTALIANRGDVRPVEPVRWSLSRARSSIGSAVRVGMRLGAIIGLLIGAGYVAGNTRRLLTTWTHGMSMLIIALAFACLVITVMAMTLGAFAGAVLAPLVNGFSRGAVPTRTRPNEEIRRSAQIALAVWFGVMTLAVVLALAAPDHRWLAAWVGLGMATATGLRLGGLATIQHGVLRVILWRSNSAPLAYVRFLDWATDLVFMRRVGSGYIYVHRMLLEYFASLDTSER